MLSREETLLLLLFTSPTVHEGRPAIVGSTRLQKLVFLATRESPALARYATKRYTFVAYDFGPYSNRLEKDVEHLAMQGMVYFTGAASRPQTADELTFEYLMGKVQRPAPNTILILTDEGFRAVKQLAERLEKAGLDPDLVIKEFERIHGRFTGLNLVDLLRFVYEKYPSFAVNSKRPDLRPEKTLEYDEADADEDEDGDPS